MAMKPSGSESNLKITSVTKVQLTGNGIKFIEQDNICLHEMKQ